MFLVMLIQEHITAKQRFAKPNASIIPYIGRFAYPFYVIFLQYKRSNPSSPMVADESDLL